MNDTPQAPARRSHGGLVIGLVVGAVVLGGMLVAALLAGLLFFGVTTHHSVGHIDHAAPVQVETR